MTNTYRFAAMELDVLSASFTDSDNRPLVEEFREEILSLCEKFGNSGQSGGSAPYTAQAISKTLKSLLLQKPIYPVTGIEQEWTLVSEQEGMYQNCRCSALFKSTTHEAYYLDAIVWKNQHGMTYSGSAILGGEIILSRQCVKSFPFTPKTFYIDVIEEEVAKDDWEFHIKDASQLKKVFKYYNKFQ